MQRSSNNTILSKFPWFRFWARDFGMEEQAGGGGWVTPLYTWDYSIDGMSGLAGPHLANWSIGASGLVCNSTSKIVYVNGGNAFGEPIKAMFQFMPTNGNQNFSILWSVNAETGQNRGGRGGGCENNMYNWFKHSGGDWNSNAWVLSLNSLNPYIPIPYNYDVPIVVIVWIDPANNHTRSKISVDGGVTFPYEDDVGGWVWQRKVGVFIPSGSWVALQNVQVFKFDDI